jgi:hypothetical protein
MDAMRDGIKTYSLIEGNFVTEAGLHAGILLDGTIEASCTIVASDEKPTKCLRWNRTELVELLKKESGMRRAFKAVLSWDIIRKLKGQRTPSQIAKSASITIVKSTALTPLQNVKDFTPAQTANLNMIKKWDLTKVTRDAEVLNLRDQEEALPALASSTFFSISVGAVPIPLLYLQLRLQRLLLET